MAFVFNLLRLKQGGFGRNGFACLWLLTILLVFRMNLFMFQYKILLYSLDGRLLSMYRAYEWSLGVKSIAWSPSSQFLAIGSYDEKVGNGFIFSHLSKPFVELHHNSFVLQCFLELGAYLEPCNLEEDHGV